jgi:peptidoglycan/LPS O-acetylase OafA/YrhL
MNFPEISRFGAAVAWRLQTGRCLSEPGMQRYYYGLDGLRFFSAIAVCLFHLAFYVWASDDAVMSQVFADRATFQEMVPFAWSGWIGVQIFFVISGFVIAHSANAATPATFLRGRLLRLWPAAWVCATITLTVRLMWGEPLGEIDGNYLRSITLWPKGPWIGGVYWSLAVEVMFYAMIFLLLLTGNFRRLPLFAWILTIASSSYILLAGLRRADIAATGDWFTLIEAQAEFLPLRHGVYFALGIWMWMLSNRVLPKGTWPGVAIAIVFGFAEIGIRAWDIETTEAVAAAGQPLAEPMLVWLLALGVLVACTRWPERFTPRSPARREMLKLAGKITYPLYLVHGTLGAAFVGGLIDMKTPAYVALLAGLAFVVSVATVVALFAEPLMRKPLRMALDAAVHAATRRKLLAFMFRRSEAITPDRIN